MPDRPILVAIALDHESDDVLRIAADICDRTDAPMLPVHAIPRWPLESDARAEERIATARAALLTHLATPASAGITVLEPVIQRGAPAEVTVEAAQRANAQMIVTGGGGPATIRRWVLGSTAEAICGQALVPVWMARGGAPVGRPILCPTNLSPQSRVGFTLALRLARLFQSKLIVLTVLEEHGTLVGAKALAERTAEQEATGRKQLETFLNAHDLEGVEVEQRVVIGPPAQRIVEAAEEAALLVIGSRGFGLLRPTALGGITEKAIRFSRASVCTVRDPDPAREKRERSLRQLAKLKTKADALMAEGNATEALPLLQLAAARAPANAALQDALAQALAALGRLEEAEARRHLAKIIRESFS